MYVFLRDGSRVEVLDATGGYAVDSVFCCLDAEGAVVQRFPAEDVLMVSSHPWDSLMEAVQRLQSMDASSEDTPPSGVS